MSIVKNRVDETTDVTITVFPKNKTFAQLTLPSTDGTAHPLSAAWYPKKYLEFNNGYFDVAWRMSRGCSIIVKCELSESASGHITGGGSGSTSMYIYKTPPVSSTPAKIQWFISSDSTPVYEVNWTEGVHLLGFKGGQTGDSRWVKPFYDGQTIGDTEYTATGGVVNYTARIGALAATSPSSTVTPITGTGWAMRLYEVMAYSRHKVTSANRYFFHYYACSNTQSSTGSTAYRIVETRRVLNYTAISGDSPTISSADFDDTEDGYGLQLPDDMRIIAKDSALDDLLAIAMEDGGADEDSGWASGTPGPIGVADYASVLTNGSTTRNCAFFTGKGSTHIPLPADWSSSNQSEYAYELGQLIRGRRPKWSIWNDVIKFGFYIENGGTSNSKFAFNIFKRMNLTASTRYNTIDDGLRLEWFQGYNTNSNCNHPPKVEVLEPAVLDLHNGAFVKCQEEQLMGGTPGQIYAYSNYAEDSDAVFKYATNTGKVSFAVGNLVPWNYTRSQMEPNQWLPVGAKLKIMMNGVEYLAAEVSEASDVTLLDPDFPAARKALYQSTGFEEDLELTKNEWVLLDHFDTYGDNAKLDATLTVTDDLGNDISASNLMPSIGIDVSVSRDPYIYSNNSRYRVVVDYHSSSDDDLLGIVCDARINSYANRVQTRVRRHISSPPSGYYEEYYSTAPFPESEWTNMITALNNGTVTHKRSDGDGSSHPYQDIPQGIFLPTWSWEWKVEAVGSGYSARFAYVYGERTYRTSGDRATAFATEDNPAQYSNVYDNWVKYYEYVYYPTDGMIYLPFVPVKLQNEEYVPDYTKNNISYVALIELYYMSDDNLKYEYRRSISAITAVKDIEVFEDIDEITGTAADQIWGPDIPGNLNKGIWTNHQLTTINGNSGGSPTQDIIDLAAATRVLYAEFNDFGIKIRRDTTAIYHIYKTTDAPVFVTCGGWNDDVHAMIDEYLGTNGRDLEFTKTYYTSTDTLSETIAQANLVFMAFDTTSSHSVARMSNCNIEVRINNTLYDTILLRDFSYYPMGYGSPAETYHTKTVYGSNNCSIFIHNAAAADEYVKGLNGVYQRGSWFGITLYFPKSAASTGDVITLTFVAPS